jgi:uncharacterized protein
VALSKNLLEVLVCPKCKGEITLLDDNSALVCPACRLRYPIKDDIPMMLVDEAETMGQ